MQRAEPEQEHGIVVVVESGSSAAAWTPECRRHPESTVVLAQQPDEAPRAFAQAVARRIERLAKLGFRPVAAVLAVGVGTDEERRGARMAIARTLRAAVSPAPELVLAGYAGLNADSHHELFGSEGPAESVPVQI